MSSNGGFGVVYSIDERLEQLDREIDERLFVISPREQTGLRNDPDTGGRR